VFSPQFIQHLPEQSPIDIFDRKPDYLDLLHAERFGFYEPLLPISNKQVLVCDDWYDEAILLD
jgi:hypothetical protein